MFHKPLFICTILAIIGTGIIIHRFSETTDLISKYQKLGLVQTDLKYEKVEKTWGNQGLIFYQVKFPFIDVPMESDSMTLSLNDSAMNIKLKNAHIDVTEGLKKLYGSQLSDKLNSYIPYKDFFNHILTTMAVMGIDKFVGDITVNTLYSDIKTMQFTVQMEQENSPTIQMEGVIHIPIIGAHQISDLWNGEVDSATIKMKEPLLQRYVNYVKSRQVKVPEFLKQDLIKIKEKAQLGTFKNILK